MSSTASEAQLRRQLYWLRESWSWIMGQMVLSTPKRSTALDVGCGPGLVMELFSPLMDIVGVDIDPAMVRRARGRGLRAVVGDALQLPFADRSIDVVYCSFTLMWVGDAEKAVEEMARVARRCVVCLAEPDYGGRICHPPEVALMDRPLVDSLRAQGADPFAGRRLGRCMEVAGLKVECGVHSGVWSPSGFLRESEEEWASLANDVAGLVDDRTLSETRAAWDRASADGSLFLFNPVFYAIGRK